MRMRSKLFVPASRPELFEKALASSADAVSFDLEDAVAKDRKADARAALANFLKARPFDGRQRIVVRVNAVASADFERDMQAVAGLGVDVINLPMVEDSDAVRDAAALLDRIETDRAPIRPIGLLVNIETPRGLRRAAALASSHARVCGLQIGYADLLEPCGIDRRDHAALAHVRLAVRFAAAQARVPAYDGAFAAVDDLEGYRAECNAARRHGFAGKSCIHPTQIAAANQAFLPTVTEVARARRVVAAAAEAQRQGIGAYLVDGHMVDEPFVVRAHAVLALAQVHGADPAQDA